jgi:hypothetical protein
MLELQAVPHSWIPQVHMGLSLLRYLTGTREDDLCLRVPEKPTLMITILRRKFTNIHFRIYCKSGICIEHKIDAKASQTVRTEMVAVTV